MSNWLVPYILLGKEGGVMLPDDAAKERTGQEAWDAREAMPDNGLRDAGRCRCGNGIAVFHLPAIELLGLQARTILRCRDRHGAACKFRLSLRGIIRTYGELLLALKKANYSRQGKLIDKLEEWLKRRTDGRTDEQKPAGKRSIKAIAS